MTIRQKALLSIGVTLLGLLVVIYSVCAVILTENLKVVENQATQENIARVQDALEQRLDRLDNTTSTWAQWDDTCRFLLDRNQQYFKTNLTPETITTMKSEVVVLLGADRQIVFGTNHDLTTVKNSPLDPQIRPYIRSDSQLLAHNSNRSRHIGLLQTSPYPLLVVTRPVVNNTGTGPVRGTLLTGIYLNEHEVKDLSQITHLQVAIHALKSAALPTDFREAHSNLSSSASGWVKPLDPDTVAGYSIIDDIFGNPALMMRVTSRRDIFRQGQLGIRNVILVLLTSGAIFGLVTYLLLERLVLARVSSLSSEVQTRREQADFSRLVYAEGEDELSNLSKNINGMLLALQLSLVEREASRQAIETSLHEKDILLKEIYHRVKNNLQIVSSLLTMQSDGITDPAVKALFDESRSRVHSMALVHEKLYQSNNLGSIDFGEYLDNLSRTLLRSYNNRGGRIRLQLEAEEAQLDMDLAVPCGLIVNELITNSLKYGFPGDRSGTIFISLKKLPEKQLCLSVADDGIGIPVDFDIDEAQSLGMQLVTGLTQQLEGHYELNRENGTRWNIYFFGKTD